MRYPSRIVCLAAVVLFVIISHHFFDRGIAVFFGELLKNNGLLKTYAADIPDLLFPIASVITCISWIAFYLLRRKNICSPYAQFFHLIGWTVPLSFFLKTILKNVFGMTNTRAWLVHREEFGFHWFQGGGNYSSFPSGHMAVFMVLVIALIRYFPRFRFAGLLFLLMLAAALVVTDYHFLSDVVAGAFIGLIVDHYTCYALERRKKLETLNCKF